MKSAALAATGWLVLLAGCGLASNPQPPTLWLPRPVRDLQASRAGNEVRLRWKMPRHTTDNVELRGPQRAHICWMRTEGQSVHFNEKLCQRAGDGAFAPDQAAEFAASLPPQLQEGTREAVAFYVELQSPAGKTAGPSNPAWVATGAAPPAVTGLALQTVPAGVVLHWNQATSEPALTMRIQRSLMNPPKASKPTRKNEAPPVQEQTLEVDLSHGDPGGAIDQDASLDHLYRYTAERVLRVALDGRTLEITGLPSEAVTIEAKDVFPPAVPEGLAAVADEQAHAIDLSWRPDTDPDLAGYMVYRRTGTGWECISGRRPVVPPSFEDKDVTPGHRYAYAVSAVDQDGNESMRSAAVIEALPQP